MSNPNSAPLPGCSVAIKCADDPLIERCLQSIDDPTVAVNAVITPSDRIAGLLRERGIPYVVTEYGNIAKSAQLSVETAENDTVIVMDSDAYFAPGAVGKLRSALLTAPIVKPRLEFLDDGTQISRVVADSRRRYNAVPTKARNPGIGLRRAEVAALCGGYVFNPDIRWTEDADLDYRLRQSGTQVTYVPEAVVYHDPISLGHELRCSFRYGIGKRLSVEHTPSRPSSEELRIVLGGLAKVSTARELARSITENGIDSTLLAIAWRTLYIAGYHAQKHTGHWTVDKRGT